MKKKIPALLRRVRAVSLIQKSLRTFLFFLPETGREKEIRNGSEKEDFPLKENFCSDLLFT
ncbi:hypothetical protein LIR05_13780, partial [[Ruminococcus] lactaris]|uniref:hypothetical protein n=1 Tax=[Ruminococcus] lactaris TaxID=46228 RepID=UPI001D037AEB